MTHARKSLFLSLLFHTLMATMAFIVLTQMRTSSPMLQIPMKHIMVLSLSDSAPKPKHQEVSDIPVQATPPSPPKPQPIASQPIASTKAIMPQPTPTQTPIINSFTAPITTTPTPIQRSVQNVPVAETVQIPQKPKVDLASEKRTFYAQLRTKIQNNLRYPTAARRRGMEGDVGIHFVLSSSGNINGISVQRGEGIFHNAAIAAVNAASGIDIPKNLTDSMPMEIELTLEFKLNNAS